MLVQYGYRYVLRTDRTKSRLLARHSGCCRLVWNLGLTCQREQSGRGQPPLSYPDLCVRLLAWKQQYAFLQEAPAQLLQQALRDLDLACRAAAQGLRGFPRFKRRGERESFRLPNPEHVEIDEPNSRVRLPKLGWLRYRKSRPICGAVRNVTVKREPGTSRWLIVFCVQTDVSREARVTPAAGLDMGVTSLVTVVDESSSSTRIQAPNSLGRRERYLRRLQRALSRKSKHSSNWKKHKARIARYSARTARIRSDFLHKVSTRLAGRYGTVAVEDLAVKKMTANARRSTPTLPHLSRKTETNRLILDRAWRKFRQMLEYKCARLGGRVVAVPAAYSSQECSACGVVDPKSRPQWNSFKCVACGHAAHADENAAANILRRGLAKLGNTSLIAAGHAVNTPAEARCSRAAYEAGTLPNRLTEEMSKNRCSASIEL